MILTRSELAKMAELFDAQELPDTFPDELEFSFLEVLAPTMTLKDYLAMPEQERRKWWISSQIMEPIPLTGPDPETGEDLFVTGFYFEPVLQLYQLRMSFLNLLKSMHHLQNLMTILFLHLHQMHLLLPLLLSLLLMLLLFCS